MGDGDAAAGRALITAKLPRVHGLALRMLGSGGDADDVAQEAFLRTWRQAPRWKQGNARFDSWLHRVVLNLCYDRLRRRREIAVAEPPDQIDPSLPADSRMAREQMADRVRQALARLPDRQREAIMLHSYQELSNGAIAETMGIGVEAVESLLARGRRTLRSLLEGVEP